MKKRFTEEQIVAILREGQDGSTVKEVCARHNLSEPTYYVWKRKCGGMEISDVRAMKTMAKENGRLKRLVADQAVQIQILQEVNSKNGRPDPQMSGDSTHGERWDGKCSAGCRALRLQASSFYKVRRKGWHVGTDMVQRYRRSQGLQVRERQCKMRRLGLSTAERQRADHPRHVWSWDFIQDRTENGSAFKMLTIIDEYSRECLKIWPSWSIRACAAIKQLEEAMEEYGEPEHLRSDNGPEFIAYAVQDWLKAKDIKTLYIQPGSPWENAYIESFHDKLRDELLNRELFVNLLEARVLTEAFRDEYNQSRPHSSLNYKTPSDFAANFSSPMGEEGSKEDINNNQAGLYFASVH